MIEVKKVRAQMIWVISILSILTILFSSSLFAESTTAPLDDSSSDGIAQVYKLQGGAVLTQKGSPIERNLKVGDKIQAGDTIVTLRGASLTITFDRNKLNMVRISADSEVTFTNIEPTDMKIETGSIFNVVDGLASGSTWKVSTPSAVAAVRGTVFMTTFMNGEFYAATLSVPDDGKDSMITVQPTEGDGIAKIFEGKEIAFKDAVPGQEIVEDLNPDKVAQLLKFFQEVLAERPELEAAPEAGALEVLSESNEMICDAMGENCSTKTCKQTTAGEVCTYA